MDLDSVEAAVIWIVTLLFAASLGRCPLSQFFVPSARIPRKEVRASSGIEYKFISSKIEFVTRKGQ